MEKITLKAARVNANMTQEEAAKRLGISSKTLWQYEKGHSQPRAKRIDAICSLYRCTYNDIVFLTNNND